jgi:hypothetical protein
MGEKRGESKVTLVYGQMNEPPGARARVALTGGIQMYVHDCQSICRSCFLANMTMCINLSLGCFHRSDRGRVLP